jgi:hypothetical protein
MTVRKLSAFTAALALLTASLPAAGYQYRRTHYRHYARPSYATRDYVTPGPYRGVYSNGQYWRHRDNYGWDSSCFDLPYLPDQFACGAHSR